MTEPTYKLTIIPDQLIFSARHAITQAAGCQVTAEANAIIQATLDYLTAQPAVPAMFMTSAMRAELVGDTAATFYANGPETPQVVRDVIEYVDSWLQVQLGRAHDAAREAEKAAPVAVNAELLGILKGVLKFQRGMLGHLIVEGRQEEVIRATIAKAEAAPAATVAAPLDEAAIRADERERCAALVESHAGPTRPIASDALIAAAEAIRDMAPAPAGPVAVPLPDAEPSFTAQQVADACMAAGIPYSRCESLLRALWAAPAAPASGGLLSADDVIWLTRRLGVALNGDGAAPQASLGDVVSQVEAEAKRRNAPVLTPAATVAVPIPLSKQYPGDNERVLIFDAEFGEWHVGWNAYAHTVGGLARPGTWILPFGDTEEMQITHWMPLPEGVKLEGGE